MSVRSTIGKSMMRRWASTAMKARLAIGGVVIVAVAMIVMAVIGAVTETAGTPVRLAEAAIDWAFGASDDEPDRETVEKLNACMTSADEAADAVDALPVGGINVDTAYGWILYSLAHSTQASSTPSTTPRTPAGHPTRSTADSYREESTTDGPLSFEEFHQRWTSADISNADDSDIESDGVTPESPIPSPLLAIDPDTDYTEYAATASAATVRAITTQVIPNADDKDKAPYLHIVTTSCFTDEESNS